MRKINNQACLDRLSYRILAARKKKNLAAIAAILLTTIMFTVLFTISSGMIESFQKTTMRQVGSSSMAELKDILPEQYELFAKDREVKNPSYRIFVGNAVNNVLLKMNTEIYYATEESAKAMFCLPEHGTMPKERMDIAVSTRILDTLKLPHRIGETVRLQISVNGEILEEEFTLCGYWEGDRVAMAQMCFLSREYCDSIAPTPKVPLKESKGNYSGYWTMEFDFSNSWNIEKKTKELIIRNGYKPKEIEYGINWAYTFSSIDKEFVICFLSIACLILVSGYLIIYNIFSLNVVMEIQSYGLYKTIGMTEKQLKRLVRRQAVYLSLAGVPAGCILGAVFGKIIFPFIIKNYETGSIAENSLHPFFLLFAAVFSFFTVWISCSRPCRMAARVSPVEAVKYAEISGGKEKRKKNKKKGKRRGRAAMYSLGWANLGRNKKKTVLVICSLSLSLILLNSVYSIVHGFSLDRYVSELIVGDAMVGDASILNLSSLEKNVSGVAPEMQKSLADMEGVRESHNIYCNNNSNIFLDDIGMGKFDAMRKKYEELFEDDELKEDFHKWIKEEKMLPCTLYGMDAWGTEQLTYYDGEMDWEKFQTGNYAVVSRWSANIIDEETRESYYKPGENISFLFPDGTEKEYEVMAVAEIPYAISCRFESLFGANAILPETEYITHMKDANSLWSILFMEDGKEKIGYNNVRNYTERVETELDCVLKQTYQVEFNEYVNMYWITGGCLSLILAMIGLLNFINAMGMEMLARKREFAMMEAVGMTERQLKGMLAWEGGFYALLTAAVSVIAGAGIQEMVVKSMVGPVWFFEFHITIAPILFCIPALILIACFVPLAAYQGMAKESLIERMSSFSMVL